MNFKFFLILFLLVKLSCDVELSASYSESGCSRAGICERNVENCQLLGENVNVKKQSLSASLSENVTSVLKQSRRRKSTKIKYWVRSFQFCYNLVGVLCFFIGIVALNVGLFFAAQCYGSEKPRPRMNFESLACKIAECDKSDEGTGLDICSTSACLFWLGKNLGKSEHVGKFVVIYIVALSRAILNNFWSRIKTSINLCSIFLSELYIVVLLRQFLGYPATENPYESTIQVNYKFYFVFIILIHNLTFEYHCSKYLPLMILMVSFVYYVIVTSWFKSDEYMLSRTLYKMLLSQCIERNPGPNKRSNTNLSVRTFNCNGLGDSSSSKFRRILVKVKEETMNGGIVLLQETHIKDKKIVDTYWKGDYVSSCISTNSAGVMILFGNAYECLEKSTDSGGRLAMAVIESTIIKVIVVNVYCPNDHALSKKFMETTYDKIYEMMDRHPDAFMILGGDLNTCISNKDYLNRKKSNLENGLTDFIVANNKTCEIEDSYRCVEKEGGYTWARQSCYSRLDYIFVSKYLSTKITNAKVDWAFEKSDHASVYVEFITEEEIRMGPGLTKTNAAILNDPVNLILVKEELEEMLKQMPTDWDPHMRLEYLKMAIRTTLAGITGKARQTIRKDIMDLELTLNEMHILRTKISKTPSNDEIELKRGIIDSAIYRINEDLSDMRNKQSAEMIFKAKANWYEYGEKSNKYFMNLNKKSKKQKVIEVIQWEGKTFRGGNAVNECITGFYQNLYDSGEVCQNVDDFYDNCTRLSQGSRELMEHDLTEQELLEALKTCSDTAPGTDGIPYSVYKKLWGVTSPFIIESWKYSCATGKLPISHSESVIVMMPKEGKDAKDIKNWRPLTLSNCDAKIITKALAIRMNKVLNEIIDKHQTAYIKGRSVSDNLRSILFIKDHCLEEQMEAVLISLDAKKAFDSVDHGYIQRTLEKYGFGPNFIKYFKTLYSGLTARVLINGHLSNVIRILRGVKQGDALSCAIFIICIDPLLRNINSDISIKMVDITTKETKEKVNYKAGAFADDVGALCRNDEESVRGVFEQYERLTKKSGLELNAEKTEILSLHSSAQAVYNVEYNGKKVQLRTMNAIKICGIWFCNNKDGEYKLNIEDKITKLESKIKIWKPRNLTFEGKSLIIKTFGLSQLIYGLQVYGIKGECLKRIERAIFGFLWIGSKSDKERGIDRIKRSVLKNEYSKGGLNISDIDCLNRSLKLRQFIRAGITNHPIRIIQAFCMEQLGHKWPLEQEFHKITKKEMVTSSAQSTLNFLCDYAREMIIEDKVKYLEDSKAIFLMGTINISQFLLRKSKFFLHGMQAPLKRDGIVRLFELRRDIEFEGDRNKLLIMENISASFPKSIIDLVDSYNEDNYNELAGVTYFMNKDGEWKDLYKMTTKEMQVTLKVAMRKVEAQDFAYKLQIENYDNQQIVTFREQCKNVKLRHIYFRLVSRDFYTKEKMLKYGMSLNDECNRCGEKETYRHLLWECVETRRVWNSFNEYMNSINQSHRVDCYEKVFDIDRNGIVSKIKVRVIQAMIQIERPTGWGIERVKYLAHEIKNIETYNSTVKQRLSITKIKWQNVR